MPAHRYGQHTLEYSIERSPRRRSLALVVDPIRGLVAHAPEQMPDAAIADFVRRKAAWAAKHLKRQELHSGSKTGDNCVWLRGQRVPLVATVAAGRSTGVRLSESALVVSLPTDGPDSPHSPERAHAVALGWLRRRAGPELRPLVARYAAALGRATPPTLIRAQSARWGSCAPDGTIRLNWRLVCLPPRLAEYVCAHECCHLVELNHSPRFWRLLARIMPDFADRRRELREDSGRYAV